MSVSIDCDVRYNFRSKGISFKIQLLTIEIIINFYDILYVPSFLLLSKPTKRKIYDKTTNP